MHSLGRIHSVIQTPRSVFDLVILHKKYTERTRVWVTLRPWLGMHANGYTFVNTDEGWEEHTRRNGTGMQDSHGP